jgi:hypothetical protein
VTSATRRNDEVQNMVWSGPARSLGSDSLATSGGLTTRESFSVVQSGLLAGHRGGGSGSKCLLPTCVHRGYEIEWGCRVVLGARFCSDPFCSELSRRGEIANHCSNDFGLAVVSGSSTPIRYRSLNSPSILIVALQVA